MARRSSSNTESRTTIVRTTIFLENIGKTQRVTNVYVNRDFYSSDLKIATGLVESHFMTGISGGRKSICPGLVDVKTIQRFHGVEYLENPNSDNLILEGNPCHEEAMEVAQTVGVDFIVNPPSTRICE